MKPLLAMMKNQLKNNGYWKYNGEKVKSDNVHEAIFIDTRFDEHLPHVLNAPSVTAESVRVDSWIVRIL